MPPISDDIWQSDIGVGRAEPKYTFENISSSQVEPEKYWLEPSRAKEFFNNFYMAKIEHEIF